MCYYNLLKHKIKEKEADNQCDQNSGLFAEYLPISNIDICPTVYLICLIKPIFCFILITLFQNGQQILRYVKVVKFGPINSHTTGNVIKPLCQNRSNFI